MGVEYKDAGRWHGRSYVEDEDEDAGIGVHDRRITK